MEQNRIDKLLADYLADTISEKDFLEMRSRVNQMTDDELATILHKAWMENKVSKEIFKAKAVLLIPRIKKELSHPTNTPLSIKEKTSSLWPSFVKYAAVIAVAILSASTLYFYQEQSMIEEMMAQEVIFSSPTGQRANLILPDGTEVNLNSHSILKYKQNFGKENRELSFTGEAFFKVAKDESKPFIIHSKELKIRVLGTKFNFYNYDSEEYAEVALVEGRLQVNTNDNQSVQLLPNEKLTFEKKTNKLIKAHTTLVTELGWKKSQLEFEETPLREVIKTIERCYHVQIIAEEGKWLDDHYSAIYKDISLDEILEILQIHYHFNVKKSEEINKIYLTFNKKSSL